MNRWHKYDGGRSINKVGTGDVINVIEAVCSKDVKVWEAISDFVRRFP